MSDDTPIIEKDFILGATVVDIGDIRVKRGLTRRPHESCSHHSLIYDKQERRIWCQDCEKEVAPFDAFIGIVSQIDIVNKRVERMHKEAEDARKHALHLIACKELEKMWRGRKMTPTCPSCNEPLLPEDFTNPTHMVSLELAQQKRKNRD